MSLYIHIKMFMHFGQDAALAFSEMVRRRNPDFNKLFARNSEPVLSLITGESREYANTSKLSRCIRIIKNGSTHRVDM
jgi:hypothetical protein